MVKWRENSGGGGGRARARRARKARERSERAEAAHRVALSEAARAEAEAAGGVFGGLSAAEAAEKAEGERARAEKLAAEADSRGAEFVNLFYGSDVSEEDAQKAGEQFGRLCPGAEINVVSGGQPVYYYIISME